MKMKLIMLTIVLLACGTSGLIAWSDRPADEGEVKRANADKIMCLTYGENWFEILVASEKTNRTQMKTMAADYESAIGYHHPK